MRGIKDLRKRICRATKTRCLTNLENGRATRTEVIWKSHGSNFQNIADNMTCNVKHPFCSKSVPSKISNFGGDLNGHCQAVAGDRFVFVSITAILAVHFPFLIAAFRAALPVRPAKALEMHYLMCDRLEDLDADTSSYTLPDFPEGPNL
jgi:hypothetical protein